MVKGVSEGLSRDQAIRAVPIDFWLLSDYPKRIVVTIVDIIAVPDLIEINGLSNARHPIDPTGKALELRIIHDVFAGAAKMRGVDCVNAHKRCKQPYICNRERVAEQECLTIQAHFKRVERLKNSVDGLVVFPLLLRFARAIDRVGKTIEDILGQFVNIILKVRWAQVDLRTQPIKTGDYIC